MATKWSQKTEKAALHANDEFLIIDSEDAAPATKNKRVKASLASPIRETTLSLTAAQIRTGFSSPVEAVPVPQAGKAIEVISASVQFTRIAPNFSNTNFVLITETADNGQFELPGNLFDLNGSQFRRLIPKTDTNNIAVIQDKRLLFRTNADSAAGNGTAKIFIAYRILTITAAP